MPYDSIHCPAIIQNSERWTKIRKIEKSENPKGEQNSEIRAMFQKTSKPLKDEQRSKLFATRTVGRLIHNFVLNIWKHFKTFVNNGLRCLVNTRSLIGLQSFGELWADNLSRKSNDVQSGSTGMVKRTRIKVENWKGMKMVENRGVWEALLGKWLGEVDALIKMVQTRMSREWARSQTAKCNRIVCTSTRSRLIVTVMGQNY